MICFAVLWKYINEAKCILYVVAVVWKLKRIFLTGEVRSKINEKKKIFYFYGLGISVIRVL